MVHFNRLGSLLKRAPTLAKVIDNTCKHAETEPFENCWVDGVVGNGIPPIPFQKLRPDVFRHKIRVSKNVRHNGPLMTSVTH